jgi:hypothetical protein
MRIYTKMKNKLGLMMAAMVIAGWMQVGLGQNSSYQIIKGKFTWDEAKSDAENRGGHLAVITSQQEQNVINQIVKSASTYLWLGGTSTGGEWKWITGENWNYTNWSFNEPSNDGAYLSIWANESVTNRDLGTWNDSYIQPSTYRNGYLLEIPSRLNAGLVAYYPLNGNANDESGNGNDGIVVGAAASVADRHGNQNSALNTSVAEGEKANSNHIKAPVAGSLTESFSVTGWFKFEESKSPYTGDHLFTIIPDGNLHGTRIFVSINHQWEPNEIRIQSFHQEDGYLGCVILNGNFKELFEDKWAHIVFSFTEENPEIYINSEKQDYYTEVLNSEHPLFNGFESGDVYLGNWYESFSGSFDDVRIYERTLSEAEVVELYELEKPISPLERGLVAYYPFNGNANDESGNGNDGEVIGAKPSVDRYGVNGSAYDFSNYSETKNNKNHIEVLRSNEFALTKPVTFSGWFSYVPEESELPKTMLFKFDDRNNDVSIGNNSWGLHLLDYKINDEDNDVLTLHVEEFNTTGDVVSPGYVGTIHIVEKLAPNYYPPINLRSTFVNKKWVHIVSTLDADNNLSVYINGNKQLLNQGMTGGPDHFINLKEGNLYIGNWDESFSGSIDDVRVYNRVLSEPEVAALYELELSGDSDSDRLTDYAEIYIHETDPKMADTDEDGLNDGDEVNVHKTNPNAVDTDEDGLSDEWEVVVLKTDPLLTDTDGDGITDGDEDSDSDGLSNADEINIHFTNPLNKDTDGDDLPDGIEIAEGFNPLVGTEASDGELSIKTAVELEFFTLKSQSYQLQWSNDLNDWNNDDSPFKGVGGFSSIFRPAGEARVYWRLKVQD